MLSSIDSFVHDVKHGLQSFSFGDLFIREIEESELGTKQTVIIGYDNKTLRNYFNEMISAGWNVGQIKDRYFATYLGGNPEQEELRKYRFKKIEIIVPTRAQEQIDELMESWEYKACLKYFIGNENGIIIRFQEIPF